ncbi:LOW QUALITY PROTEIN: uncharacterized protein Dsimw501_GD21525 [Drosophila simulans]|nr:LOW QUALITY PROTEIN: uncharacterized protein Dsimw501_GD21525 [Drosophila simulans]
MYYFSTTVMWSALGFSALLVFLILPKWACATKMKAYLDLDTRFKTQLQGYSEDLQDHISTLNRYIDDRKSELANVGKDREVYLGNPLNSFSLLHHLHFDWPAWRKLMEKPLATEYISEIQEMRSEMPTKDEYTNSIKAAMDFHKNETQGNFELSPLESLQIALHAYDKKNYTDAENWLNVTLNGYKNLSLQEKDLYKVLSPVIKVYKETNAAAMIARTHFRYFSNHQMKIVVMKSACILLVGLTMVDLSYSNAENRHSLSKFKLINILKIQENAVKYLENYIHALETKLKIIDEVLFDLATYHIQFERDKLAIASSPVASYSLIHHMQSDWTHWQLFLQEDPGKDELASLMSVKEYLPTKNDISEVCQGISKILNAYQMPPQDIANGVILGTQTKNLMSLSDCVALSDYSREIKDYNESKEWLKVAISMLDSSTYRDPIDPSLNFNAADLYLKLAEVYVKQQNWPLALETVEFALKSNPRNAQLVRMQKRLSYHILLDPPKSMELNVESNKYRLRKNASLYCFYDTKIRTFYSLLAPIKAEVLFIDPLVTLYHE